MICIPDPVAARTDLTFQQKMVYGCFTSNHQTMTLLQVAIAIDSHPRQVSLALNKLRKLELVDYSLVDRKFYKVKVL